jgi:hypothetical protein
MTDTRMERWTGVRWERWTPDGWISFAEWKDAGKPQYSRDLPINPEPAHVPEPRPKPAIDQSRLVLSRELHARNHANTESPGPHSLGLLEPTHSEGRPNYPDTAIADMAAALGVCSTVVRAHRVQLDQAAWWYRQISASPRPSADADLGRASLAALGLLRAFGVERAEDADDGCRHEGLSRALATVLEEEELCTVLVGVGRLAEAARHAAAYQRAPAQAEVEAADGAGPKAIGADRFHAADPRVRLAVRGTLAKHAGDLATDHFVWAMVDIYASLTGKRPTFSSPAHRGPPTGRFLDFLTVAARPLGFVPKPHAVRALINRGLARQRKGQLAGRNAG